MNYKLHFIHLDCASIVDSCTWLLHNRRQVLAIEGNVAILLPLHLFIDVLEDHWCHFHVFFIDGVWIVSKIWFQERVFGVWLGRVGGIMKDGEVVGGEKKADVVNFLLDWLSWPVESVDFVRPVRRKFVSLNSLITKPALALQQMRIGRPEDSQFFVVGLRHYYDLLTQ